MSFIICIGDMVRKNEQRHVKMPIWAYADSDSSDQCASAQSHQGLCCPLINSLDITEYTMISNCHFQAIGLRWPTCIYAVCICRTILTVYIYVFGHLLTIIVRKFEHVHFDYRLVYLQTAGWKANSKDPDQTPRVAASDQGLHCLLRHAYPNT